MPGALLTAVDSSSHIHLIVGSNPLAAARCSRSLQVGAKPKLIAPSLPQLQYNLKTRVDNNEIEWLKREFHDDDLRTLGRDEVDGFVDVVFVTLGKANPLSVHISNLCRRLRIPINVTDAPELCTFTLLSTYSDGPLHIGVTTSGRGCKLASRIRREVVASLPADLGSACERLGTARRRIWEEDHAAELAADTEADDEETGQQATFNKLITSETRDAAKNRRIRWLSQICEYWPLGRLAAISDDDVDTILHDYSNSSSSSSDNVTTSTEKPSSLDHRTLDQRREHHGRIVLAGSGPGHPDLLTTATLKAIQHADVILADKLVPAAVLDLIPRRTPVHIARKFPGNAERAQEELLELGLAGLQRGQMVLRLKQGDPYIYGRGAEEFAFFRTHGYTPTVIPGITSALSAPLFAAIPPTHRAVADQVLICTGTGRKGAAPDPPPYLASRTVVFLMALHRLAPLIDSLLLLPPPVAQPVDDDPAATTPSPQSRSPPDNPHHSRWPPDTPCAVIERASCADQRVIRTSLQHVCAVVEDQGSRPPGLLVVGLACRVLWAQGSQPWVVEDGFKGLDVINGLGLDSALNKSLDL